MKQLNIWYRYDEFENINQKFVCLVKFCTIDAGQEYRLMIFHANSWRCYLSRERHFGDRITEFMPIENL